MGSLLLLDTSALLTLRDDEPGAARVEEVGFPPQIRGDLLGAHLGIKAKIASWAPCVVHPNRSACIHGFADSSSAAARVGFHQNGCLNPIHSAAFQTQPAPHDTIVFSTDYLHSRCAQR